MYEYYFKRMFVAYCETCHVLFTQSAGDKRHRCFKSCLEELNEKQLVQWKEEHLIKRGLFFEKRLIEAKERLKPSRILLSPCKNYENTLKELKKLHIDYERTIKTLVVSYEHSVRETHKLCPKTSVHSLLDIFDVYDRHEDELFSWGSLFIKGRSVNDFDVRKPKHYSYEKELHTSRSSIIYAIDRIITACKNKLGNRMDMEVCDVIRSLTGALTKIDEEEQRNKMNLVLKEMKEKFYYY